MEREGTSPAMVVARFMLLQVVLAAQNGPCAIEDRLIDHNPCERVRLPRVVQPDVDVYSPDEFDEIVRHMDPWCQAQVTVQGALVSGGALPHGLPGPQTVRNCCVWSGSHRPARAASTGRTSHRARPDGLWSGLFDEPMCSQGIVGLLVRSEATARALRRRPGVGECP
jgi:hypothetical protein